MPGLRTSSLEGLCVIPSSVGEPNLEAIGLNSGRNWTVSNSLVGVMAGRKTEKFQVFFRFRPNGVRCGFAVNGITLGWTTRIRSVQEIRRSVEKWRSYRLLCRYVKVLNCTNRSAGAEPAELRRIWARRCARGSKAALLGTLFAPIGWFLDSTDSTDG